MQFFHIVFFFMQIFWIHDHLNISIQRSLLNFLNMRYVYKNRWIETLLLMTLVLFAGVQWSWALPWLTATTSGAWWKSFCISWTPVTLISKQTVHRASSWLRRSKAVYCDIMQTILFRNHARGSTSDFHIHCSHVDILQSLIRVKIV